MMLTMADVKRIQTQTVSPVLSLYLNVNPGYIENQAATPSWRVWLKNALRDIEAGLDREQLRVWQPLRERAITFFEQYRAESRGLVMFIGAETMEYHELPLIVDNHAAFGEPSVTPLFWKLDEYERYLIVLVDQQQARFLTAYLGHIGEEEQMHIDFDMMTGSPEPTGGSKDDYEAARDEQRAQFYRSVIDRTEALRQEHETNRIVLGGSDSAHAVRSLMPNQLAAQMVDLLPIPLASAPHEIVKLAQPSAHDYERRFEMQLLDGVIDLAKSGGRGALGRADVLAALSERRVDLIIAPWPLDDQELLQMLPAAALESGSVIELVHGEAAQRLHAEGGLAARLYYTV